MTELRYTADHEWVRRGQEGVVRIGITAFAQDALGDVVYVSLPSVGDSVAAGDACGEVESTKSVSDIYAPVAGEITAVNDALDATPVSRFRVAVDGPIVGYGVFGRAGDRGSGHVALPAVCTGVPLWW